MRKVSIAIALASLFLTPVAWGCERGDMEGCSMSACPLMSASQRMPDCHGPSPALSSAHQGCDLAAVAQVDCCAGRVSPEPTTLSSSAPTNPEPSPLVPRTEGLAVEAPPRPPERAWMALETRTHDLGRFTLLSAYLL